jgi:hypothetical protein
MANPQLPRSRAPLRHLIAIAATLMGAYAGSIAGQFLSYAIASATDRDISELKDMLIWSTIMGWPVGGLAGLWLALSALRYSVEARRIALVAVGLAVIADAALLLISFDWPKSSGWLSVAYELRLPKGAPIPRLDKIDLILWADKSGHGCYIARMEKVGDRVEIAGSFSVFGNATERLIQLRLDRETEGYWRMPIRIDAKLEKEFGPWQRIEFIPHAGARLPPLPPGDYEIRYRVRKYL